MDEWTISFGTLADSARIVRERVEASSPLDRLRALEALRSASYDDPESPPRLLRVIGSLMRHRVRFVVVGAHALAALGRARMTDDLDVLVEPSTENAARVADALRDFRGFDALASQVLEYLAEPDRLVSIGRAPISIDILTGLSGVTFDEAWSGRVDHEIDGHAIAFLGLAEMVRTKRAAGRTKDLLDLALLEEAGLVGGDDEAIER